ncbi:MAG: TPM domain-containing protein [Gammaproteobacteria bacterium]
MVKKLVRVVRHLVRPPWRVATLFPAATRSAIANAIRACETQHGGEIRFAVEGALHLRALWHGQTARERALEVFSQLRIWDTADNNGVLIYLLLADRDVEIIADRGIVAYVGDGGWQQICYEMERAFGGARYEEGVIAGVRAVSAKVAQHFPRTEPHGNQLPDAPVLL